MRNGAPEQENEREAEPVQWSAGSGRALHLEMTREQAESAAHSGRCDDDVDTLLHDPEIARQIETWDADALAAELREYGAWDAEELADHDANLARMVWLAANDITEGNI